MQTTTLTITEERLQSVTITVTAQSRAEITLYTPAGELANTWYALVLDGRYYDLVMWKHTIGREETIEALDRVLAQVQQAIARLQPPPFDAIVAAVLERLAFENSQSAELNRAAGELEDAAFFQRATTAYTNALIEWNNGIRPSRTTSGAYLLPSRRAGEPPHIVRMDGDWICDCKARSCMHWPIAMVVALEIAHDDAERFDDHYGETAVEADEPPLRPLGARIAEARKRLLAA